MARGLCFVAAPDEKQDLQGCKLVGEPVVHDAQIRFFMRDGQYLDRCWDDTTGACDGCLYRIDIVTQNRTNPKSRPVQEQTPTTVMVSQVSCEAVGSHHVANSGFNFSSQPVDFQPCIQVSSLRKNKHTWLLLMNFADRVSVT